MQNTTSTILDLMYLYKMLYPILEKIFISKHYKK